ncbi:MAG: Vacuolar protein sorting-associated protein 8 [Pleopsidium flavum]|nr:MAG: Vacuolar protein sorting-associated protein 8 [Pleopsidium flavum]
MPDENDVDTEDDGLEAPNHDGASDSGARDQHKGPAEDASLSVADLLREEAEGQGHEPASKLHGAAARGYPQVEQDQKQLENESTELVLRPGTGRPSSADGSLSTPDDTPSLQGSVLSSPGSSTLALHSPRPGFSPTPSFRPFDRRFQSRLSSSPLNSPRALSPAFLNVHSRQSSSASQIFHDIGATDTPAAPWDVVRWTKLRKLTGQVFSEVGKRKFGRPTCIAVSASIAMGTSKGIILIFDYHQNLKSIIGPGTKAVESGAITAIALSADHTTVAGGHANGNIYTWEIAKSARPFLHIQPLGEWRSEARKTDGHVPGAAIVHVGFLGTRHTALTSADDRGMAFSHLASRGMGVVARPVKSTRILGRYPDGVAPTGRPRKASSVLAFSPLPLGNTEQSTDSLGLVAMLTPYLLVIVSTTPVAQTQHKAARPKEVVAHGAMSAALAWFPAVKLKAEGAASSEPASKAKLVYCWSNILTILEISEIKASEPAQENKPPSLSFQPRSRWKAEEAIVAVQWLGRSVLGVLTITQQLIILEDGNLRVTDSSDFLQKQIYHSDLFSRQLHALVEQLDEDDASMHGVVADAFYMSFRAYKGRLFVLGTNDISIGTLSNWADRLLALMEEGDFIAAIQLATRYYNGDTDKLTVGLPDEDSSRHALVHDKLLEMMSASLKYAFGRNQKANTERLEMPQLKDLAAACVVACLSMDNTDFLFDDAYTWYEDGSSEGIFLETLEPYILDKQITSSPPIVVKALISHYTSRGLDSRLEEMICHLDTATMDIDQITTLCKQHNLYDALIYVWNHALGDYITPLVDLFGLVKLQQRSTTDAGGVADSIYSVNALKIFPYLSYIFTSRVYPTGNEVPDPEASKAKTELYSFLFSGKVINWPKRGGRPVLTKWKQALEPSFPYLRLILDFDAPSFLSTLNVAFEDSFLNSGPDRLVNGAPSGVGEGEQAFGIAVNRQYIVSILLEVMNPEDYPPEDTIYLDMFIARNMPKFPQFILLSGTSLHRVLVGLCNYPAKDIADDCQLSVEYLLSMYHPPDLETLVPLFTKAHFYRVLKSVYKSDKRYAQLLQTCFEDQEDQDAVFECIGDCLRPRTGLNQREIHEVQAVIANHARDLVEIDTKAAASTIAEFAPDLHTTLLDTLEEDPPGQYAYLQTILERESQTSFEAQRQPRGLDHGLVEKYVRLMCDYEPHHVNDYIERLKSGDLRLDEVLPALESSGVIDAAVVLMAREGQVREGMERLVKYLGTLEAALLGLLDGAASSSDVTETEKATEDLLDTLQRYSRVGIWLAQGQSKAAQKSTSIMKQPKRPDSVTKPDLSAEERIWLDLIDAIVRITRNVSAALSSSLNQNIDLDKLPSHEPGAANNSKISAFLRTIVQQAFTALLTTSTRTRSGPSDRSDLSFLRILRAFLTRASLSSPSFSDLRAVLAAIFSAYSYEESLLGLANRLLDKDLFVHVSEAATLRQRGWRPRGQICEGCGRRVWGPGAGGNIWDEWQKRREEEDQRKEARTVESRGREVDRFQKSKGKAAVESDSGAVTSRRRVHGDRPSEGVETEDRKEEDLGALMVFSCRHIFHRKCLEQLQQEEGDKEGQVSHEAGSPEFTCAVCT